VPSKFRNRIESGRAWVASLPARYEHVRVVDLAMRVRRRDEEASGAVAGSAIAFCLFLFFVPLLLFVIGLAGLVSGFVSARDLTDAGAISGSLRDQIRVAFAQSGGGRWFATFLGLLGMVWAGRSLSKALWATSANAWGLPPASKASVRVVGSIVGLVSCMGLIAVIVNRLREELGFAVASVSFVGALVVYVVAWLVISLLLPRATPDPGAVLPGAVFVAFVIAGMHAVSELYLPGRFEQASTLYGTVGATVVTLGWFFILGRSIVFALVLDAVLYEQVGSVSSFVFGLPVLRILPRRSERLRRYFALDDPHPDPTDT
jgi:uncharacterized BrkB/YihY/UPF0761 family membrane protein